MAELLLLREVANKIFATRQYKKSNSKGKVELLHLLQRGEIVAVIKFPSAKVPTLRIPKEYWTKVVEGTFQASLTVKKINRTSGDYLVPAWRFVREYITWLMTLPETDQTNELSSISSRIAEKVQIYIPEAEWERFFTESGLDTTLVVGAQTIAKVGTPLKGDWAQIYAEISALLVESAGATKRRPDLDAAGDIVGRLESRGGWGEVGQCRGYEIVGPGISDFRREHLSCRITCGCHGFSPLRRMAQTRALPSPMNWTNSVNSKKSSREALSLLRRRRPGRCPPSPSLQHARGRDCCSRSDRERD
jgi:hypothetical protein